MSDDIVEMFPKFKITYQEAKELIKELEASYITSESVKILLSALYQFVKENELAK